MAGGLFDDIPMATPGAPGAPGGVAMPGGLFGDIGPDPLAGLDLAVEDPKAAKAVIEKLPAESRQRARDMWADSIVARERAGGGAMQRVDDSVRRIVGAVPGIGTWSDEIAARANSMLGGPDYDMGVALERARTRAIDKTETTTLATLPVVGDITTGGLEKAVGTVGGALALPFARVMQGGGVVPTAVNVSANAAATGFVQGAGEADGGMADRLAKGTTDATAAGGAGLLLGGAIGKLTRAGTPEAVAERLAQNSTARAAQQVGVDLPNVAAGVPNSSRMVVGATIKELPVAGAPINAAVDRAADQLEGAAARIADRYATHATPETAGSMARQAMQDWIRNGSAQILEAQYNRVQSLVNPTATAALPNTMAAANRLMMIDDAAASTVNGRAVGVVAEALTRPQGLTYAGMQQLRTNLGAMIDDGLLPDGGTIKPALRELYGALTEDITGGLRQMGGQAAEVAWRRANRQAAVFEARRDQLTKVIGLDGTAPAEKVLERLIAMAGSKSNADLRQLGRVRQVITDPDTWSEIGAAAIHRLGRNHTNEFDPGIFVKGYGQLTSNGRNMLFGQVPMAGTLRSDLDALHKTAEAYKNLAKLRNTSGTGRVVAGSMALFGTINPAALPLIAMKGLAARVAAEALARPVTVKAINHQSRMLYQVLQTGQGQTALKLATLTMAKKIADETGADEGQVADTALRNLAPVLGTNQPTDRRARP